MGKNTMAEARPVAIVVWNDAHGSSNVDVTERELPHEPKVMTTMGWLLRDDEKGVSIASEKSAEDGVVYYRGHTFVPRGMVRSVTMFNLGKVRTKKAPNLDMPERGPKSEPKMGWRRGAMRRPAQP